MDRRTLLFTATLLLLFFGHTAMAASIGTGDENGVYHPMGKALAKIARGNGGLTLEAKTSAGSVANVNGLLSRALEFGVVQSDRQYQAVNGLAEWRGNPQTELRSVFSLYPEAVTILAATDSGIKTMRDLEGKKVNIGNPGSGHLDNSFALFKAGKLRRVNSVSSKPANSIDMLKNKEIDAFIYTVGHPNALVQKALSGERKMRFIAVAPHVLDNLIYNFPFYTRCEIPVYLYESMADERTVKTFGVTATLCTRSDVDEETVYKLVKAVVENLETFRNSHPALKMVTREGLLKGLSAPLHPGAERYYKEAGLLE